MHHSSVSTTTTIAPTCSGCGSYVTAPPAQSEKIEWGIMKARPQYSKLKNYTEEQFRMQECH